MARTLRSAAALAAGLAAGVAAVGCEPVPAPGRPATLTVRVSVDSAGGQADDFPRDPGVSPGSFGAAVSGSGRHVAFFSLASDLVPGDTNGQGDVFVHDLATHRTARVSLGAGGRQAAGFSFGPDVSADGRFVAFASTDTGLAPDAPDPAATSRAYVRDRVRRTTTCVSCGVDLPPPTGAHGTSISDDGRYVSFTATTVGGPALGYVLDRWRGTTELVTVGPGGERLEAAGVTLSRDGRTVAFTTGATPSTLVWVRDLDTATTRLVGPSGGAGLSEGALSADGALIAFNPDAGVGAPLLVVDTATGATLASYADLGDPSWSADGRFIAAFDQADGRDPATGEPSPVQSVWRLDRTTGALRRVSVTPDGGVPDNGAFFPDISADGGTVAYESPARDIVPGDTNEADDVFAAQLR